MRTRIGLGIALLLASTACTGSVFSNPDAGPTPGDDAGAVPPNGGGGSHDDGGTDSGSDAGTVDAAPPPPGCDVTKLPTEDACVVNDSEGVFVSSSMGSASGDGTKAKPFASLDAAIAAAKTAHKRVYACADSYAEQIHLADGVDVFGYFDCSANWAVGSSHAKVIAPASPVATASGITDATRVEAVDLIAPNYTTASQSSIGLIANNSPALVIKSATIHAGTGGDGSGGTSPTAPTDSGSAKNGANGQTAHTCGTTICIGNFGAVGGTNACTGAPNPPAAGGQGGSGGLFVWTLNSWVAQTTAPTTAGSPTVATQKNAVGGAILAAGLSGGAGGQGTDGASSSGGVFSASGFTAGDGVAGGDGQPGQSGGGAGGAYIGSAGVGNGTTQGQGGWGEGGAGGGAGGCPGLAAQAGKGGGASVAIVALQSALVLDHVTLETSSGGAGGESGVSTAPTGGGVGGQPAQVTKKAGDGGAGGRAGISGNGAGGPSVGIAYQGTKPQMLASSTLTGAGGHGGLSHTDTGTGLTVPAGADGVSADSYAF